MISKGMLLVGSCFGCLYPSDSPVKQLGGGTSGLASSSNQWVGGKLVRRGDDLKKEDPTEQLMETVIQEAQTQRDQQSAQVSASYCSQIKVSFDLVWRALTRQSIANRSQTQAAPLPPIEYACKNDPCGILRCCFCCLGCVQLCCEPCSSDQD